MPGKKNIRRLQETSAEDLVDIAKRLRKAAAEIQGMAAAMEHAKMKPVGIEGFASLESAFKSIGKFVANSQKKIREF